MRSVHLAVAKNAEFVPPNAVDGMLYIRPIVFGSGPRILLSPTDEYTFCVYVTPAAAYHGIQPLDALILEDFDRAAPRGTGSGKVGGNYAPVMKWADKAKSQGYALTLHLDSQTRKLLSWCLIAQVPSTVPHAIAFNNLPYLLVGKWSVEL
jgi:branched-chain amino acid aminotransferase